MPDNRRVIVVGAGAAGLCAALAAREAGVSVLMLAKSAIGMANCTAYAGGGFTAPIAGLTPDEHVAMTREVGRGLSEPNMHMVVSEGAAAAFDRLRGWGVRYDSRRGGISVSRYGLSRLLGGTGMTLPLRDRAAAMGVESWSGPSVTGILRADGGRGPACGVELYDPATGSVTREPADAVIVATGGGGAVFPRSDNPVRTTGDGYRLLWQAGVEMVDMEFVQWYPLGYADAGFPVWMIGLPIVDHVPLEDGAGDRFYDRLLAEWGLKGGAQANLYARDRSAVALARMWRAGREVFLRYDLADQARLPQIDSLAAGKFAATGPRPVRVAPLVHYFCGGAVASPDGVTSVPGLYACGEVVGGFDGANRMGGNALTAVTVLSQLTGDRVVADLTASGRRPVAAAQAEAAVACGTVAELARVWESNAAAGAGSGDAAALRSGIQQAVGQGLGLVREAAGISGLLAETARLRRGLLTLGGGSLASRLAGVESLSMLTTAELIAAAALRREESRGGHFREDFPAESEAWTRHIVLTPGGPAPAAGTAVNPSVRLVAVGAVTPRRSV